jgi:hypothetical protein
MPVLRTEVTGRVAIDVFRINVCARHKYCLNHTQITSYASNMKWRSEVSRSRVDLASILYKQLNQIYMSLIAGNM